MYQINFYPYKDFTYDIFGQKLSYHAPLLESIRILVNNANTMRILHAMTKDFERDDIVLSIAELIADYGNYKYIDINRHFSGSVMDVISRGGQNLLICPISDKSFDTVITYKNHMLFYNGYSVALADLDKFLYQENDLLILTCKE